MAKGVWEAQNRRRPLKWGGIFSKFETSYQIFCPFLGRIFGPLSFSLLLHAISEYLRISLGNVKQPQRAVLQMKLTSFILVIFERILVFL